MSVQRSQPPPLPGWLMILGSAFVVFHLLAIGVLVLSAPSGPWLAPPPFPPSQVEGPRFALGIAELTTAYYLRPLKMTHNYHFLGNRPDAPGVTFEVRLKDADGHVSETLHFPSPRANAWLRYRHTLLAQNLGVGDDEQVEVPQGEVVPAKGQKMPMMRIWDPVGPSNLVYHDKEMHLIPKNAPASRPREWTLIMVRSYLRHLCREHGASSAELGRQSRQAVLPGFLFGAEPEGTFDTLVSTFEETQREK